MASTENTSDRVKTHCAKGCTSCRWPLCCSKAKLHSLNIPDGVRKAAPTLWFRKTERKSRAGEAVAGKEWISRNRRASSKMLCLDSFEVRSADFICWIAAAITFARPCSRLLRSMRRASAGAAAASMLLLQYAATALKKKGKRSRRYLLKITQRRGSIPRNRGPINVQFFAPAIVG